MTFTERANKLVKGMSLTAKAMVPNELIQLLMDICAELDRRRAGEENERSQSTERN